MLSYELSATGQVEAGHTFPNQASINHADH